MSVVIGKIQILEVIRQVPAGWLLVGDDLGEILIPNRYVPENMEELEEIEVFVYCDSEDRPIATTEMPYAQAGEFACLEVTDIHPSAGAFLDWGLPKELLLPYREQPNRVKVGERVVVFIMLDDRSDRLVASRRLERHFSSYRVDFGPGDAVDIMVYEKSPMGYNVIVEREWKGLLLGSDVSSPLEIGQSMKAYVRALKPGGKIDLSLNAAGYGKVAPLSELILQALEENGGSLAFSDKSDPVLIREAFDVSKKAFKQALGTLYKQRKIQFDGPGITLSKNSA